MTPAGATPFTSGGRTGTVIELFLILGGCYALHHGAPLLRRLLAEAVPTRAVDVPAPTPDSLRRLAEWAFDFERDLLERRGLSPEQKRLFGSLLTEVVMPLIGHVRLCNVDAELEHAVATVLRVQVGWLQGDYVVEVWLTFLIWSRKQAGMPAASNFGHALAARRHR
jgi:hypothetical protein